MFTVSIIKILSNIIPGGASISQPGCGLSFNTKSAAVAECSEASIRKTELYKFLIFFIFRFQGRKVLKNFAIVIRVVGIFSIHGS